MRGTGLALVLAVLLSLHTQSSLAALLANARLRGRMQMSTGKLTLAPIKKIAGEVTLPGSKSLSNRVLLLSALSTGTTVVENLLDSADIRYMLGALKQLKIDVKEDFESKTCVVVGNGGAINNNAPADAPVTLNLGNAGTAMRPLAGVLCAGKGNFVLDGTPRMRERPIVDLVEGLQQLNLNVKCSATGCPPVEIAANGLHGGTAEISGQISSQYLSALLMMAPLSDKEVVLKIKDELMSAPYVHMTMNLMRKFGCIASSDAGDRRFVVPPGTYKSPGKMFIEGDASSASYFLAGAAITGGPVTVHGCGSDSVQGDARFARVLENMGCDVKFTDTSITVSRPLSRPLPLSRSLNPRRK